MTVHMQTGIKTTLLIIRTWRSRFDKKWPVIGKFPHPLGRLRTSGGQHSWIE